MSLLLTACASVPPREDPWRRTSGMHKVRKREQLAVVRELWIARDEIASKQDVAPGKLLSVKITPTPEATAEPVAEAPVAEAAAETPAEEAPVAEAVAEAPAAEEAPATESAE